MFSSIRSIFMNICPCLRSEVDQLTSTQSDETSLLLSERQSCNFCTSIATWCRSMRAFAEQIPISAILSSPSKGTWEAIERISASVAAGMMWTWGGQMATNPETNAVNPHYVVGFMIAFAIMWQIFLAILWHFRGKEFTFYNLMVNAIQQAAGFTVIVETFFPARTILRTVDADDPHAVFLMALLIAGFIGIAEHLTKKAVERLINKIKIILTNPNARITHINADVNLDVTQKTFIERMFSSKAGRFSSNANIIFIFVFLFKECTPFKKLAEHYFGTNPYSSVLPFFLLVILCGVGVTALLTYLSDKFPPVESEQQLPR